MNADQKDYRLKVWGLGVGELMSIRRLRIRKPLSPRAFARLLSLRRFAGGLPWMVLLLETPEHPFKSKGPSRTAKALSWCPNAVASVCKNRVWVCGFSVRFLMPLGLPSCSGARCLEMFR